MEGSDFKFELIARENAARLRRVASEVVGQRLAHVQYGTGRSEPAVEWPTWHLSGEVDQPDDIVLAEMQSGRLLVVSWAMNFSIHDDDSGLHVSVEDASTKFNYDMTVVDKKTHWSRVIGEKVTGISVAWDKLTSDVETVWALRLHFASGESVIVTTGERYRGGLGYHPTAVLVIFDSRGLDVITKHHRLGTERWENESIVGMTN